MKKEGVWGGAKELLAAADLWGVYFIVVRPGLETVQVGRGERAVWLELEAKHYECLQQNGAEENRVARKQHIKEIAEAFKFSPWETKATAEQTFVKQLDGGVGSGASSCRSLSVRPTPSHDIGLTEKKLRHLERTSGTSCAKATVQSWSVRPRSMPASLRPEASARSASVAAEGPADRRQVARRVLEQLRPPRNAESKKATRWDLNKREKAVKIQAAADRHDWMHRPVREGRGWKCETCGLQRDSVAQLLAAGGRAGPCSGRTMPPKPEVQNILL